MKPTDDPWVELRVLVVNTHVGMLLLTAVRFFVKSFRPHIVLLQEVQSPLARGRLRLVFGMRRWSLTGVRPPSTGRGSAGSIVAARRDRLRRTAAVSTLVTRFLDRFHPERRLTYADLTDKITRQPLRACSIHTWGGAGLPQHVAQVASYEAAVAEAHRDLKIAIFGGDCNEKMNNTSTQIEQAMQRQGMTQVIADGLDALWVSTDPDVRCMEVKTRGMTRWRGGEKHHDALLVTLAVRRLAHPLVDSDADTA